MSILDTLTKSLVDVYSSRLNDQEQKELIQCLEVLADDQKYNKFQNAFPDKGEFSRDKYPKQLQFFKAGKTFKERGFIAANRVGKSDAGMYECTAHATGLYPDWWEGRRYTAPVLIWIGGDTATTVRDIIQKKMIGTMLDMGSGLIPKDLIVEHKTRRNVPDAIEMLMVRHITGGVSTIMLKTYEQGRITWQGDAVDFIWVDEECPQDVYGEAVMRLMTTKGSIITTFTPLQGTTPVVMDFLDNSQDTDAKYPKHVTLCTWDDVPHLTEEEKAQTLASTPPQLRDARSKGVPTVGSGMIYPVDMKNILVDDFKIPNHWQKLYGLDVGWNNTAAIFGAWNREEDIIYLYSEHKKGGEEGENMVLIHTNAIQARGKWIKGVIDPASRGRTQTDGENLYMMYRKAGLKISPATNAVEAGIYTVYERLSTGRLKIFRSCTMIQREFALYIRDEKGKIRKADDHLLDALRYMIMAPSHLWSYPQEDKERNKVVDMSSYMRACT